MQKTVLYRKSMEFKYNFNKFYICIIGQNCIKFNKVLHRKI